MTDIHNKRKQIERTLQRIKDSEEMSDANKKVLEDFYNYCNLSVSPGRTLSYLEMMMRCCFILKKDFVDVVKEDVQRLLNELDSREYSVSYKKGYRITIKKFFKWLRNTDEYPPEVKWFKSTVRRNEMRFPTIITKEELLKIIEAANHLRDKAFIFVLYESGCRIGEMLSLKMKDVNFDEVGAFVRVHGKTGPRTIRLVQSSPILAIWIDNHPYRNDMESPLWTCITKRSKYVNLTYYAVRSLFKRLKAKTGVTSRFYPYVLRHTRATDVSKADRMSDSLMKCIFGWTQGSNAAASYINLTGRDADDAILRMNGIKRDETKTEDILKPRSCFRCKNNNTTTADFCNRCGMPLNDNAMVKILERDTERKKADEILDKLIQNPEFKKMLLSKIKETIKS